ncbi:type III secretion system export apparatus subunit SctS [Brucella intermedia]|uniref:type III secretion system export apparatus subunit SctS n=1 Tax=Brucella intermedia TaxID=94625 RepID=UPI002360E488|nr:type III secretion system export apparatus subunit SctS [Brucella intermedia]
MPEEILSTARTAILIAFYLSMPTIIAAAVTGLIVALVQTLIQLQEQTISFAIKLVAVAVTIALSYAWMAHQLLSFFHSILAQVSEM